MGPKTKLKAAGRSGKGSLQAAKQESSEQVQPPNWPKLQPLMPATDLELDTILEDQIVLIHKFFTNSLCQQYVSFLSDLPLATTPGQPKKGEALRVNDRFQIEDASFARQLWEVTPLKTLVTDSELEWGGTVCGLNPRIRIYRYRQGQFFDQHYDESNLVTLPGHGEETSSIAARTTWTLLIYLTGPTTGCVGGETIFYPEEGNFSFTRRKTRPNLEPISVAPEVGMALLHKHGNDCLLHEGAMVQGGEKWIIRSDLCVRR